MHATTDKKPLKICYFGTYRANYARNAILVAGLRQAGVTVIECHVPLWKSIADRVEIVSGGWFSISFIKRVISTYWQLFQKYRALTDDYDILMLGYPGQPDVFMARLLSWWHGKPLTLDVLMSLYLVAIERHLDERGPFHIKLLWLFEWITLRFPDLLIANTSAYIDWLVQTYHLPADRFRLVTMGVDNQIYQKSQDLSSNPPPFTVLYYGTYIPNHGAEIIIEAARLLEHRPDIQFHMVGDGPTKAHCQTLAQTYHLSHVTFTDWVEKTKLPSIIAEADVILGVFSLTTQSQITIHNKIYEGLAMQKTVITGYSPTVAETFQHGKHLFLVERNDPRSLAGAILWMVANPTKREILSKNGHQRIMEQFTMLHLGQTFKHHLASLTQRSQSH